MTGGSITSRSRGIQGYHSGTGDLDIAVSDGVIVTTGAYAQGIYGSFGNFYSNSTGNLAIAVADSRIVAAGRSSRGIYGFYLPSSSGDVAIAISDSEIDAGRPGSYVVRADHFGTGNVEVTVTGSQLIGNRAWPGALNLWPRHGSVAATLTDTSVEGSIFTNGGGDDRLTCDNCWITGDVHFYGGEDRLFLTFGEIFGNVYGVERIRKTGDAWARLRNVQARGGLLSLEGGALRLNGHLDLGSNGILTIHNPSRLIFEAGGEGREQHSRITAGAAILVGFSGDGKLYIARGAGESLAWANVLYGGYFQNGEGDLVSPVLYVENDWSGPPVGRVSPDGQILLDAPSSPITEPPAAPEPPTSGQPGPPSMQPQPPGAQPEPPFSSPGFGIQPVAGDPAIQPVAPQLPPSVGLPSAPAMKLVRAVLDSAPVPDGFGVGTLGLTDAGTWVHSLAGFADAGNVRGLTLGMDRALGNGLRLRTAFAPAAQMQSDTSALVGDVWTTGLGFRDGSFFSDVTLAWSRVHGEAAANALGGRFLGEAAVTQTHLEARAGRTLSLGGLSVTSSVSLHAGQQDHAGRRTTSGVLDAQVPGFVQDYRGADLRLDATGDWREGSSSLRWRPSLRLFASHTVTDGPQTLRVQKQDREDVLSFVMDERVAGLPEHSYGLGLGAELTGASKAWSLRLGYAGEWNDGAPSHAVQARFGLRF